MAPHDLVPESENNWARDRAIFHKTDLFALGGLALAAATVVAQFWTSDIEGELDDAMRWVLLSLIVAGLSYLMTDLAARRRDAVQTDDRFQAMDRRFGNLEQSISSCLSRWAAEDRMKYVGQATAAARLVATELENATEVRNTFVLFGKCLKPEYGIRLRSAYMSVLKRGQTGHWTEIVSTADNSLDRVRQVLEVASKEGLTSDQRKRYTYAIVRPFPVLNMTWFKKDGKENLYIGWGCTPSEVDGAVFYTHDKAIIKVFCEYFFALMETAVFRGDGSDVLVGSHHVESFKERRYHFATDHDSRRLEDVALLDLAIDAAGDIVIGGRLFDISGVEKGTISSVATHYARAVNSKEQSKLYAMYRLRAGPGPNIYAHAVYSFPRFGDPTMNAKLYRDDLGRRLDVRSASFSELTELLGEEFRLEPELINKAHESLLAR